MAWVVDTNVLSELTKPRPDAACVAWLRRHEESLVVPAVVLGELRFGILQLPAGKKRRSLLEWFDAGVSRMPCLDFDAAAAEAWAQLLARLRRRGEEMPIKDSLIAAIAKRHKLPVATRNVADFRRAGVKVTDPFRG